MSDDNISRTLKRNCIDNFLLRFDVSDEFPSNIAVIVNKLASHFVRMERKTIQNFTVKFTEDTANAERNNSYDYVLISDDSLSLTISCSQNAFWLETTSYVNNSAYKKYLNIIVDIMSEENSNIQARRIGMRFINNFKCSNPSKISKIYNRRLSTITRNMLTNGKPVRVIGVEHLKVGDNSVRLQYGVPNKFFPSEITSFDLFLDIDSFIEDTIQINEWKNTVSHLNHLAYDQFIMNINPTYLGEMK